jgi:hypothetical protein
VTPLKILHEGVVVDADELTFTGDPVVPQKLKAEDGAILEFQGSLANLFKLHDKKQADGKPIYVFITKLEVRVTPPNTSEGQ